MQFGAAVKLVHIYLLSQNHKAKISAAWEVSQNFVGFYRVTSRSRDTR